MKTDGTSTSNAYEVHQKKGNLRFAFVFLIVFSVVLSIGLVQSVGASEMMDALIFAGFDAFSIFFLITVAKRLFGSTVIVQFQPEHLVFMMIGKKPIAIPWIEIKGFVVYRYQKHDFVGLLMNNEDSYVESATPFARMTLKANQKLGFPAFNIAITEAENPAGLLEGLNQTNIPFYQENA